jgi:NAD-dependent deacetylase
MNSTLSAVADVLWEAEKILFITGAGLSADSGLPTYRGVGGLYEGQDTEEGISIEDALSGLMLSMNPALTWKYLWQIGVACRGATFNRGHEVIAEIERWKPNTWVLTQNVDGLHRSAGSQNLIEVHGRASELYCVDCSYKTTAQELLGGYSHPISLPPRCPTCGGLIRPDVVLFGEFLSQKTVAAMQHLMNTRMDLVFIIGTSGAFPYITQPVQTACITGIPTVEINPTKTALSEIVDYRLESTAADTLNQLWSIVQQRIGLK